MTLTPAVFDGVVIATVLISAILAMVRGFLREILALVSWVVAAVAAYFLYRPFSPVLETVIEDETWRYVASAAIIFFVSLIVASYVTMKISNMLVDGRVNFIDRIMGFVFGVARGLLILVIAYIFLDGVLPDKPAWIAEARTQPLMEDVEEWIIGALPSDIGEMAREWTSSGDEPVTRPAPSAAEAPVPPADVGPGVGEAAQRDFNQFFENGAGAPR